MTVDLIVNPASGPAVGRVPRTERVRYVSHLLRTHGATTIRATETLGPGDGARAVRAALEAGTDRIVVWGGDGTLNDVAAGLLDTGVTLGIIPGGSGNGFARGLGLPLHVKAATELAMVGRTRDVDTGLVGGHAFLNVAGIGLDAAVAARFNTRNLRRGLLPYVTSILAEWRTAEAHRFTLRLDDAPPTHMDAHLAVVCNGQQYGHGARIAPAAALDDGLLDVVAVPQVTLGRMVRHGWRLFDGTLASVPGVFTGRARRVEISHGVALPIHLDGEVMGAETARTFEIRPRSLRVVGR